MAQATAPILDSTEATDTTALNFRSLLGVLRTWMDLRPPESRSKMTHSCQLTAKFAVMHNAAFSKNGVVG